MGMEEKADGKEIWTPLKVLQWAVPFLAQKGLPHPRLDAELLVGHALGLERLKVYLQFDRPLNQAELAVIRDLLKRRALHEPVQYLTGRREFFGLSFRVGPGVLIPRPETEQLVELGIAHLEGMPPERRLVLDLGTGSGCIALALAKNMECRVWAVDLSAQALEIAGQNAAQLQLDGRIQWRLGHWFQALEPQDPSNFALILSNPPYVAPEEREELAREIRDFEPPQALYAENNGLRAYEELAAAMAGKLAPGGAVLLELHPNRLDNISALYEPLGWEKTVHFDLQGHPRVLKLENK
jgi:release factor glutamine methyltransferase